MGPMLQRCQGIWVAVVHTSAQGRPFYMLCIARQFCLTTHTLSLSPGHPPSGHSRRSHGLRGHVFRRRAQRQAGRLHRPTERSGGSSRLAHLPHRLPLRLFGVHAPHPVGGHRGRYDRQEYGIIYVITLCAVSFTGIVITLCAISYTGIRNYTVCNFIHWHT